MPVATEEKDTVTSFESFDLDGESADADDETPEGEEVTEGESAPVADTEEKSTEAAEKPEETKPKAKTVEPVEPPQPAPEEKPAESGLSPEEYKKRVAEVRKQVFDQIREAYAKDDSLYEEFGEDDEDSKAGFRKIIPRFAARLYTDTYESVMQAVMAQLPQIAAGTHRQVSTQEATQAKFFERWPVLNKPEYVAVLQALGQAYAKANPKATLEQAIEVVGAQACLTFGLDPGNGKTTTKPRKQFKPATPGAAAQKAETPEPNFWGELAEEFDQL